MTPTEFRANIVKILDRVIETGIPVEIERKGRVLRLVLGQPSSKLSRLVRREDFIQGDADDLVHFDCCGEWGS